MRNIKMKNKNIFGKAVVLTTIVLGVSSCSDEFLEEKKNYESWFLILKNI